MEIINKRVVVTGAASGIGKALVHAFNKAGAGSLVAVDINAEDVGKVAGVLFSGKSIELPTHGIAFVGNIFG